ncbi:hypothetical protein CY34DRAFT_804555 [Suillus luteus UH-Slu-Lm8-n1]|uniref:Uncharacterized protein n=1 Tax=Suillus luteus UH-Slu-Lm8-n1 TaxID=930992 RepID=A0A0D0BHR6_9AGAM|nr:hypothetical protein CY34DRAFT_804555 [Suillus luteus UH-Slu-Lm8-n1]
MEAVPPVALLHHQRQKLTIGHQFLFDGADAYLASVNSSFIIGLQVHRARRERHASATSTASAHRPPSFVLINT